MVNSGEAAEGAAFISTGGADASAKITAMDWTLKRPWLILRFSIVTSTLFTKNSSLSYPHNRRGERPRFRSRIRP